VDVVLLLVVENALADPQAVVALGDGVVAGAPARSEAEAAVPGGWVTVLADCLQERAPQRFSVVDRGRPGETVAGAKERIAGVRELAPAWVVLTLGAPELGDEHVDAKKLGKELDAVVDELRAKAGPEARPPNVLLVGTVPPTLSQVAPAESAPKDGAPKEGAPKDDGAKQTAVDARAAGWNKVLASLAAPGQGIVHLDLWSDWPKADEPRAALTVNGWSLSDQGHAKIAASVCDAVLARP
jgi:lysophospholipase L1-like esterase